MLKAIDLVENELSLGRLVREQLVATIAMERNVKMSYGVLGRILQRIYMDERTAETAKSQITAKSQA